MSPSNIAVQNSAIQKLSNLNHERFENKLHADDFRDVF